MGYLRTNNSLLPAAAALTLTEHGITAKALSHSPCPVLASEQKETQPPHMRVRQVASACGYYRTTRPNARTAPDSAEASVQVPAALGICVSTKAHGHNPRHLYEPTLECFSWSTALPSGAGP